MKDLAFPSLARYIILILGRKAPLSMKLGRAQSLMTLAGAVGTAWMLGCMNPTSSTQNNQSMAMDQAGAADPDHGGGVGKTTICHIPPGNPANAHTITVGNPAVPAHLAHGDKIGACPDIIPQSKPCSDNPGHGNSDHGKAPNVHGGKVAVCHIPPGNPANAHTIVIGAPAVAAHLAHGDYLGACKAATEVSTDCGGDGGSHHGDHHDGDSTSTGGNHGGGSDSGSVTPPPPPVDTTSSNY